MSKAMNPSCRKGRVGALVQYGQMGWWPPFLERDLHGVHVGTLWTGVEGGSCSSYVQRLLHTGFSWEPCGIPE